MKIRRPFNRVWLAFPLVVDSPVCNLKKYVTADMLFDKLSELAEKIKEMDNED